MAHQEQVALLKQGVEFWNDWRKKNSETDIDLSGANLCGAKLVRAKLIGANLIRAKLIGANLIRANLRLADLRWNNLTGADLSRAKLMSAKLIGANLSSANLSSAVLTDANLSSAVLSGANLSRADLHGVVLRGVDLSRAILKGANLSGADLSRADLSRADLSGVNLSGVNLSGVNLSGANLSETDLSRKNLSGANLSGAELIRSNLSRLQALGTNFSFCDFSGACISEWHINGATQFEGIKCTSIYRGSGEDGFADRLPINLEQTFKPGEFEQWLKALDPAKQTIDLTFTGGIDWEAFFESLQWLRQGHPDSEIDLQAIEKKGTAFILRLAASQEVNLSAIQSTQKRIYDTQLQLRKSQGENKVLHEMNQVLAQLAGKPITHADDLHTGWHSQRGIG